MPSTDPKGHDMTTEEFCNVSTNSGTVRGRWRRENGNASAAFLGIPYAQPPVGDLRFQEPSPTLPWDGVRDALEYGPTPWRSHDSSGIPDMVVPGDETLNLNVFTPRPGDSGAELPVLVWIHGGGYFGGTIADPWYDGKAYNRDGVVTVAISYRLGVDGFGWIEDAPANRGVLDWIAGLEWVRENIRAFGGDPSRVTIAGQSAGGGAALTLLGIERAQHLFSGVHSISGALGDRPIDQARELARRLGERLGVEPTIAGLSTVSEDRIYEVQQEISTPPGMAYLQSMVDDGPLYAPVVDGDLITRPTFESIAMGVGADKVLLLGSTSEEFLVMTMADPDAFAAVPLPDLLGSVGVDEQTATAFLDRHPDYVARGNAAALGKYLTDGIFHSTVARTVKSRGNAPTWTYLFRVVSGATGLSNHCLDIPFWFDTLDTPGIENYTGENPPQGVATAMHGAAVGLISNGNPGWPSSAEQPGVSQIFGGDETSRTSTGDYDDVAPLLTQPFRR